MDGKITRIAFYRKHPSYLIIAASASLLISISVITTMLADRSEFVWILAEWAAAMEHLRISLTRLIGALLVAVAVVAPLALTVRRLPRLEANITPLMLSLLAVPWVLLAAAINMMIHLQLNSSQMVLFAALGGGAWIFAGLAPRQQSLPARYKSVRFGIRTVVLMLLVAETLALTQGLGSQIRFYTLYWSPALLFLYGALSGSVIAAAILFGRLGGTGLVKGMERFAAPHD